MSVITLDEARRQLEAYHQELWAQFDQKELPETLCHYSTAKGVAGILTAQALWASDILCLNDRSEWRYAIDLVLDAAGRRTDPLSKEVVHVFEKYHKTILGLGTEWFVYVTCFCEEGDLLSQWRGYASDGFSIGFV
jgi:hypothetical protein